MTWLEIYELQYKDSSRRVLLLDKYYLSRRIERDEKCYEYLMSAEKRLDFKK